MKKPTVTVLKTNTKGNHMNIKVVNQAISDSAKNYSVLSNGVVTTLLGVRIAELQREECLVVIETMSQEGAKRLVLNSDDAELLLTALLAHQHKVMGYEATIEKETA